MLYFKADKGTTLICAESKADLKQANIVAIVEECRRRNISSNPAEWNLKAIVPSFYGFDSFFCFFLKIICYRYNEL